MNDEKLISSWNIWVHENTNQDWHESSYECIFELNTYNDFWKFFNSLPQLDFTKYSFFIMKKNSFPSWEHPTNSNGSTCSIRLQKDKIIDVFEQLAILIIHESFNTTNTEINGISISVKLNWGMAKIWNSVDRNLNDSIPKYMMNKYKITSKHTKNQAEY